MSDDKAPTHRELMDLLTAAHEAVTAAHRYVHERRPKLDGSGFHDVPVAWRKHKSGFWAYTDHHPEKADLARHHGWEPLFVGPEDDDQPPKLRAAG
jgi:hypothetical protein